jgi:hypothetical protein
MNYSVFFNILISSATISRLKIEEGEKYDWVVPQGMSHLHFSRPIKLLKT